MKKVGMVLYSYPLGISSQLVSSAILLAREGYEVHLFVDAASFARSGIEFNESNIIIHRIKNTIRQSGIWKIKLPVFRRGKFKRATAATIFEFGRFRLARVLHGALKAIRPGKPSTLRGILTRYTRYFFNDLFHFSEKLLTFIDDSYVCIFGVEPMGLVAASFALTEKNIPTIYFNMELMLESECDTVRKKHLKYIERACNRKSYLTIIGDEKRAEYLIQDNKLDKDSVVPVPVAALGEPHRVKSNYLRERLGIPENKRIILYAGNIIEWSMCLEIAQAAQKWRDDLVLVLHTWRPEAKDEDYVKQISTLLVSPRGFLSLQPVSWEVLPELLSSADIGVAFYRDLGPNFVLTGLSSNKMAQYLQAGLPVITSNYPSFEVVERYGCGKLAGSPEETERLAREIFADYERYRANAFRCYQEEYELSHHFRAVLDRIKAIG